MLQHFPGLLTWLILENKGTFDFFFYFCGSWKVLSKDNVLRGVEHQQQTIMLSKLLSLYICIYSMHICHCCVNWDARESLHLKSIKFLRMAPRCSECPHVINPWLIVTSTTKLSLLWQGLLKRSWGEQRPESSLCTNHLSLEGGGCQ